MIARMTAVARAAAVVLATVVCTGVAVRPAMAQQAQAAAQPRLEGSWSGGGSVNLASGNTERARCRASFSRRSADSYFMNAVCATPSVRVSQTASLKRVSASQFSGTFFNSEYNVSGSISVTVRGDRLSAQLQGGGASASLSLGR